MARNSYTRRSSAEWVTLIEAQADSGHSQQAFCRDANVALSTFRHWKRKLGGAADQAPVRRDPPATPAFVPLFAIGDDADGVQGRAVPAADSKTGTAAGSWELDLDLGGGLRLTLRRVA